MWGRDKDRCDVTLSVRRKPEIRDDICLLFWCMYSNRYQWCIVLLYYASYVEFWISITFVVIAESRKSQCFNLHGAIYGRYLKRVFEICDRVWQEVTILKNMVWWTLCTASTRKDKWYFAVFKICYVFINYQYLRFLDWWCVLLRKFLWLNLEFINYIYKYIYILAFFIITCIDQLSSILLHSPKAITELCLVIFHFCRVKSEFYRIWMVHSQPTTCSSSLDFSKLLWA